VGHALLLAMFVAAPEIEMAAPPGVLSVDLVAAPAGPPKAVARSRPPAPPVPKKVLLPAEPAPVEPKPEPKSEPKPAPKPEPKPEPEEQEYADVLAGLRAEVGEETTEVAEEATAPASTGRGLPVSPEVAAWVREAKIHVRRSWVVPPGFRTQILETQVQVRLDARGAVIGAPEIVRRSGNPWYDDGVVRAIRMASPLPAPPASGEWTFVFVPEDSY
jgi:outer membrane biosynthesis protein TonB